MRYAVRCLTAIVFAVLLTPGLLAQDQAKVFRDAGMWNTLNVKKKLNKQWSVLLTQELRLKENYSELNLTYTDVGVEYSIGSRIKTSVVYRSIQKYIYDKPLSFRNRLMWDIGYKRRWNRWTFQYRHRLQVEVKNYATSKNGHMKEWFSRSKFSLKYEWNKRVSPYISAELRYQINDPRSPEYNNGFHRSRYQLGVDYKVNSKQDFGIYYLFQHEFNLSNLMELYIIGVEYSFDF
ncbi:MAG: DUF2490 domain-containing protein [Bacteroidetes bacterium]|nr:DUF2490 domain-containing protein [Bacteroidota bacterium]